MVDLRDSVAFGEKLDGVVDESKDASEVWIVERRVDWVDVGLTSWCIWLRDVEELVDGWRDKKGEVCVAMSRWNSSVGSESIDSRSPSSWCSPALRLGTMLELV